MLLQHSQEDLRNFLKIDAVATSQLLRGSTKGISNQYPNATEVLERLAFQIVCGNCCTFQRIVW